MHYVLQYRGSPAVSVTRAGPGPQPMTHRWSLRWRNTPGSRSGRSWVMKPGADIAQGNYDAHPNPSVAFCGLADGRLRTGCHSDPGGRIGSLVRGASGYNSVCFGTPQGISAAECNKGQVRIGFRSEAKSVAVRSFDFHFKGPRVILWGMANLRAAGLVLLVKGLDILDTDPDPCPRLPLPSTAEVDAGAVARRS
jgi:hypothetical protein